MNDNETAKKDLPESIDLNDPYIQELLLLFFLMAAKDTKDTKDGEAECSQSPTET